MFIVNNYLAYILVWRCMLVAAYAHVHVGLKMKMAIHYEDVRPIGVDACRKPLFLPDSGGAEQLAMTCMHVTPLEYDVVHARTYMYMYMYVRACT